MTDYNTLSDFEINRRVAEALGHYARDKSSRVNYGACGAHVSIGFGGCMRNVDYCNNPSDAWPVIVDNKISLFWNGRQWQAEHPLHDAIRNDNPLRAAMIVYLMMNEK